MRIAAAALSLTVAVSALAQAPVDEAARARISAVVAAARSAGGVSTETHECYYHNIACGLVIEDHVNIFGCATPSGGYYNVHRMTVSTGKRVQLGMRSPDFQTLIILTDSNSDLITYRVGVPGEFSNDLFHTTTYTGTYYIIAGPYDDLVTGRYLIYVSCATAPPTCATPTISVQPVTVRAGTSAVLTASASGGSPFKYSWFDQDEPFVALWDGATYTTPPLYRSSSYEVVATNSCGKQARSVAIVSVTPVKRRAVRK